MNSTTATHTAETRPLAVAGELYGALLAGDVTGASRLLADEVVLHVPGSHALAGTHHGPSGVLRFMEASRALTDDGETIEVLDLLGGADHAAVYCRVTATRRGRPPLDNTTVHVLRVADGRVTGIWLHNWDDITVNEFWS